MGRARCGDRKELLRAFRRPRLDLSELLEEGERRTDDAGARRISAAGARLDLANDVVAVPRLALEQEQDDEAQFAALEHAAPSAASARPLAAAEASAIASVAETLAAAAHGARAVEVLAFVGMPAPLMVSHKTCLLSFRQVSDISYGWGWSSPLRQDSVPASDRSARG